MFRNVISNTPLTTSVANECFRNIGGDPWREDISFVATLRALVAPRANDEHVYLRFNSTSYDEETIKSHPIKSCVHVANAASIDSGEIVIHNLNNGKQEANYAWLELMKSSFEEYYKGWHRLEKVTDFFRKTFYTICFVHPEEKKVIIFVEDLDIRKLHYLQCSVFAFLPWYFNPEEGVTELEMELISSLREKNSTKYEKCLATFASQYDFRSIDIRRRLAGFETRFEKLEVYKVKRSLVSNASDIESFNRSIADLLKTRRDLEIKLLGLETKISNSAEESEIMEYFLVNKSLSLATVDSSNISFVVKTYLQYFDEEAAESAIQRKSSFIYMPSGNNGERYIPAEDMELLMRAIFVEQTLRVKVCATYNFSLRGNVNAVGQAYYNPAEYSEYIPNPHIDKYTCMGSYSPVINELLANNDYISALEQCIASCKSLNFHDSVVMAEFMCELYGCSTRNGYRNNCCIELPTGQVVKPVDAIKWLREEKAKKSAGNQEATNE